MKAVLQIADERLARYEIPDEKTFTQWADTALRQDAEVLVRIVDEEESRTLNSRYGGADKPTNVLAFPYEKMLPDEDAYLGDVVMNAPLVMREAEQQGIMPYAHWAHLFIHALLHLTGYNHKTGAETLKMRMRETAILERLNIPSPWRTEHGRTEHDRQNKFA